MGREYIIIKIILLQIIINDQPCDTIFYKYGQKDIPQWDFAYLYTYRMYFTVTISPHAILDLGTHATMNQKYVRENLRSRIILLLCAGEWLVGFLSVRGCVF